MKKSNETLGQNLTEKEIIFLEEFGKSDFYDGLDSSPWDYSINDNLPYTGKVRSGVISSLEQKGIILVEKKGKGDTAGFYTLTDKALEDTIITNLVEGIVTPVLETELEEPVVKPSSKKPSSKKPSSKKPVVTKDSTTIESTWVDRVETRGFEKQYLTVLGTIHSCEVSVVRNKETNKDSYIIIGEEDKRKELVLEYETNLPVIREEAHKHYLESDRSLSEFRFTTAYNNSFLNSLQ